MPDFPTSRNVSKKDGLGEIDRSHFSARWFIQEPQMPMALFAAGALQLRRVWCIPAPSSALGAGPVAFAAIMVSGVVFYAVQSC